MQLLHPLQHIYNSSKQEGQAVEEPSQLELVREAQGSRAPLTKCHVNGELLSVFDDSSTSDVSDDEGRYICGVQLSVYRFLSFWGPFQKVG